jgi:hypothetical protein
MEIPGYDDWKLNPPEPKVIHECEVCEYEITEGELYFTINDGTILCTDSECLLSKAREILEPEENHA